MLFYMSMSTGSYHSTDSVINDMQQTALRSVEQVFYIQGGSNMTGTDLYVNKPHCAAAVRP